MKSFSRHTYRYTPYLAWLLQPSVHYPLFGKILFILFDWASACIILDKFGKVPTAVYLFNPLTIGIAARGNAESIIVFVCLLSLGKINEISRLKVKILTSFYLVYMNLNPTV